MFRAWGLGFIRASRYDTLMRRITWKGTCKMGWQLGLCRGLFELVKISRIANGLLWVDILVVLVV